jgi:hypothetical protein
MARQADSASFSAWVTRNVIGMTVTSFFADVGYEMLGAVLPGFLASIGASIGVAPRGARLD